MMASGYLVVLKESAAPVGTRYKGIGRAGPPTRAPARAGEEPEIEAWVFDERFNNDDGLIGDLQSAQEFLGMFASDRQFEIIFVRTVDCGTAPVERSEFTLLGYDVAGLAPAESTLLDWDPALSRDDFSLNSNGLFSSCEEAGRYRESCSQETVDEYGRQYIWEIYAAGGVD